MGPARLSVRLFHCLVWVPNLETKKALKTKIAVNVPQGRVTLCAIFHSKRSKVMLLLWLGCHSQDTAGTTTATTTTTTTTMTTTTTTTTWVGGVA